MVLTSNAPLPGRICRYHKRMKWRFGADGGGEHYSAQNPSTGHYSAQNPSTLNLKTLCKSQVGMKAGCEAVATTGSRAQLLCEFSDFAKSGLETQDSGFGERRICKKVSNSGLCCQHSGFWVVLRRVWPFCDGFLDLVRPQNCFRALGVRIPSFTILTRINPS